MRSTPNSPARSAARAASWSKTPATVTPTPSPGWASAIAFRWAREMAPQPAMATLMVFSVMSPTLCPLPAGRGFVLASGERRRAARLPGRWEALFGTLIALHRGADHHLLDRHPLRQGG